VQEEKSFITDSHSSGVVPTTAAAAVVLGYYSLPYHENTDKQKTVLTLYLRRAAASLRVQVQERARERQPMSFFAQLVKA